MPAEIKQEKWWADSPPMLCTYCRGAVVKRKAENVGAYSRDEWVHVRWRKEDDGTWWAERINKRHGVTGTVLRPDAKQAQKQLEANVAAGIADRALNGETVDADALFAKIAKDDAPSWAAQS